MNTKEQLEKEIQEFKNIVIKASQSFHDNTGLIISGVGFAYTTLPSTVQIMVGCNISLDNK